MRIIFTMSRGRRDSVAAIAVFSSRRGFKNYCGRVQNKMTRRMFYSKTNAQIAGKLEFGNRIFKFPS